MSILDLEIGLSEGQNIFNRVAFDGERILCEVNGAEVAIVPMEDFELLESFDDEDCNCCEK
jgi:hypothetical protein